MKKYVYLKGNITQYIIILANGVWATLISSMDLSVFSKYSTMEHLSFITKGVGGEFLTYMMMKSSPTLYLVSFPEDMSLPRTTF